MEMYEESGYFDPPHDSNPISESLVDKDHHSHHNNISNKNGMEDHIMQLDHLQHQLGFIIEQDPAQMENANWEYPNMQEPIIHQQQHFEEQQSLQCYDVGGYPATPDLLNLLQLPRCTVAPSIAFGGPSLEPASYPMGVFGEFSGADRSGSVMYDSSLHLGYHPPPPPPQQNTLRDLFNSLPQNYGLFYGVEDREGAMPGVGGGGGGGGVFQEMDGRQFDSTMLDYRRVKGEMKVSFVTERNRRDQLNQKYKTLRSLIPNPTKGDRASIVGDAIEYIRELGRTVEELKMLVEQKRRRDRRMLRTVDDVGPADMESSSMRPLIDDPINGALRSSWLQRRSKENLVDVRIASDEVNIKLTQKRKANCLLSIAKAIDELQLDLIHVTGGNIVDHYIFMFNAKICEGSSVYASAIAKKLLEAMDREYPTLPFHNSF